MQIDIRAIETRDSEEIASLSTQLGYPIPVVQALHNIREVLLQEDHCAFIAVHEKKTVGWIHACKMIRIESGPFIEICGIVVHESYRARGIGKMLVERVGKWCTENNHNSLRVRCNTRRTEAHLFYKALGFRKSKEQQVFEIEIRNP